MKSHGTYKDPDGRRRAIESGPELARLAGEAQARGHWNTAANLWIEAEQTATTAAERAAYRRAANRAIAAGMRGAA